jgi:arylsulfatase A-like enzyme
MRHLAALGLSALLATACEEARFGGGPPNVLVIAVDTLRADALSPWGSPLATPTFARLADEGVTIERAYAPTPESGPSQATLLTGLRVMRHGVTSQGMQLDEEHTTLPELFRARGYATAAVLSNGSLPARLGFDQGFDRYDTAPDERRAVATTLAAARWIQAAPEPWFLFVHYVDPRRPYTAPRPFASRVHNVAFDVSRRRVAGVSPDALLSLARAYHAEVLYLDDALGALLAEVDARDGGKDTLLVVTALHGEALGDHGALAPGASLYDEELHVPLFFRWPGRLPTGRRIETPLSLRVIAPTVAELAYLGRFPARQSRSIAASLRAGREPEPRPVFAQRADPVPGPVTPSEDTAVDELAVRRGRWKLIRGVDGASRLFDLETDPDEQRDRAAEEPEVRRELEELLDQLLSQSAAPGGAAAGPRTACQ